MLKAVKLSQISYPMCRFSVLALLALPLRMTSVVAGASSALDQARSLDVPAATETLNAEFEHADFWEANGSTLREAWKELSSQSSKKDLTLSDTIEPSLYSSIQATHNNPTISNEEQIQSSFVEAGPPAKAQAYKTQLLTPQGLRALRSELDRVTASGIPLRRPNGMNRHGCIIDDNVDGAVSLPTLTRFVQNLIDQIGRPVGRMFFPDTIGIGDDIDYFAFTIRYNADEDMELKEHRDASVVTININLNLPNEKYDGSSLYLLDQDDDTHHDITFDPGQMLIHRGSVRHAALPITSGTRHNLVIWLFGEDGRVQVAPYEEEERLTVEERWGQQQQQQQQQQQEKVVSNKANKQPFEL